MLPPVPPIEPEILGLSLSGLLKNQIPNKGLLI